jgi:hypothetical protein
MMENIEGCAYQQLWSWSDYSYKELSETRDALGNCDLADSFNERLKHIDDAVNALNGVEKLIREFDMDVIYALDSDAAYVLAKQTLYGYRLLLKETRKKMIDSFEDAGLKIDGDLMRKDWELTELLDEYSSLLDIK